MQLKKIIEYLESYQNPLIFVIKKVMLSEVHGFLLWLVCGEDRKL